jgi:hypothetical protein
MSLLRASQGWLLVPPTNEVGGFLSELRFNSINTVSQSGGCTSDLDGDLALAAATPFYMKDCGGETSIER